MTKEEKIEKKKLRASNRIIKNKLRNQHRKRASSMDCPFDVDINGLYGTCNCGGEKYLDCLGDI